MMTIIELRVASIICNHHELNLFLLMQVISSAYDAAFRWSGDDQFPPTTSQSLGVLKPLSVPVTVCATLDG